jgi:hypothetical protein
MCVQASREYNAIKTVFCVDDFEGPIGFYFKDIKVATCFDEISH